MWTALIVLPTDETRRRLRDMVSLGPFELDLDTIHIQLAAVPSAIEAKWTVNPEFVYADVKVEDIQTIEVPEDGHHATVLRAFISSPMLSARVVSLATPNSQMYFDLKRHVPHSRHAGSFIRHITDVLILKEGPLAFSREMTVQY